MTGESRKAEAELNNKEINAKGRQERYGRREDGFVRETKDQELKKNVGARVQKLISLKSSLLVADEGANCC